MNDKMAVACADIDRVENSISERSEAKRCHRLESWYMKQWTLMLQTMYMHCVCLLPTNVSVTVAREAVDTDVTNNIPALSQPPPNECLSYCLTHDAMDTDVAYNVPALSLLPPNECLSYCGT